MISRGDPVMMFSDMKKLGEGASGQVYLGTDRRTGEKVAIKVAPASDLANLKQEIALQKMSTHPCIVSYKETYLSKEQLWVRHAPCSCSAFLLFPAHNACACIDATCVVVYWMSLSN